jgi:outer membrane lipopolysaccharide assembly protein LptE/RlpB
LYSVANNGDFKLGITMPTMIRLTLVLLLAVLFGGCTFHFRHTFEADFSPPLLHEEGGPTFEKVKQHLLSTGARPTESSKRNPDNFFFPVSQGRTGLLREPFTDYVDLQRIPEFNQIKVSLGRVISHSIDFTKEQLQKFQAATEEVLRVATGRVVVLRLEEKQK